MRRFGLIGYPLGHSFSKTYFAEKFSREGITDCVYENFPLESIGEFPALLRAHPDLAGLNVTIPHKEAVMPYLDALDDEAAAIGAVNTIRFGPGGTTGYNTDVYGFVESLRPLLPEEPVSALVLGTGGSSKAVIYGLAQLGVACTRVSRKPGPGVTDYASLSDADLNAHLLIVNTTPLGMHPRTGVCPDLPYQAIGSEHILFDLVYNPAETEFLRRGRERGARTANGLQMLRLQADRAWEIWNAPAPTK